MPSLMALMRRYSIRTRMVGAILMVLVMFLLLGAVGLLGGQRISTLNHEFMVHSIHEISTVNHIRLQLNQVRLLEKQMIIDYEDTAAVQKHRDGWLLAVAATAKAFEAMLEGEEDEDNPLARESLKLLDSYRQRSEGVLANVIAGQYDTARAADRVMARPKADMREIEARIEKIAKIVDSEVLETQERFNTTMLHVLLAFGGTLVLVLLLVVPLTLLNSGSITRPIAHAAELADHIAAGDLTQDIRAEGQDETAHLLQALGRMQDSLRRMVGQVHQSSMSIQNSSAEVASGNNDLSNRTEQAAGSLQQTAGSMEQLTVNVRQSADAAGEARSLAATAADVARRGGGAVAQVVSTMDEINASSRRINDIIGTIDGIAFQTNILALNAAVEAARAGEQGRGFAVVASEVRSLAQRSATAAREIKTLISASVERVEAGTHQVADAGSTMQEIVTSVQRVSDIINEISTSSAEQSAALGQVNGSVSDLDRMTQQNASLVEQSAAAAESLNEQAVRLNNLVSTFRLPGTAASA